MKAMLLHRVGQRLEIGDVQVPEIGPNDALVKVEVCAADLLDFWVQSGAFPAPRLPLILGHEIAGEVVEVGTETTNAKPGDRVVLYHHLTCGMCRFCKSGRESLCTNMGGIVGVVCDGGYAEYIKIPSRNLVAIPGNLSFEDASIATNCVVTSLHCLRERAQIEPLDDVLIVGAGGGVGIHCIQAAKALGANLVIGIDTTEEKLEKVRSVGADHVILYRKGEAFEKEVLKITANRGVDVAIEFAAKSDTLASTYRSMATAGRMVILGLHVGNGFTLKDPNQAMMREITVTGSRAGTRRELAFALEFLRLGKVKPVIAARFSLEEANDALEMIRTYTAIGRPLLVMGKSGPIQ
jgi:D-arabinose 1-dehydrogenase-like Zn-dependent alcohol dehydrogenase